MLWCSKMSMGQEVNAKSSLTKSLAGSSKEVTNNVPVGVKDTSSKGHGTARSKKSGTSTKQKECAVKLKLAQYIN